MCKASTDVHSLRRKNAQYKCTIFLGFLLFFNTSCFFIPHKFILHYFLIHAAFLQNMCKFIFLVCQIVQKKKIAMCCHFTYVCLWEMCNSFYVLLFRKTSLNKRQKRVFIKKCFRKKLETASKYVYSKRNFQKVCTYMSWSHY